MESPIDVDSLSHCYGKRRGVVELTFNVMAGEIFGFLGPNGAGKTTTIRHLMGLLRPDAGKASVFGWDCWSKSPKVKAQVGFLPGELHPYENMPGREFLEFFASFRPAHYSMRLESLVARLDLDLSPKVRHLSKGNRQKLAIVQALMHDAPLLILDEPSSGLDPLLQTDMLKLLQEEQARGKTVFLSSHQLPEVERIANRVAIIREGSLVAVEEVERLRQLRERRMEVTLHSPVDAERFERLAGVRVLEIEQSGRHYHLGVRGGLNPLLAELANLPVADMIYQPADLESIFMHFFTSGSPSESDRDLVEIGL
jgi:ABC-2 type transport system ATP-binding protein